MTIIDISWPLMSGMTTYKNREDFTLYPTKVWETHQVRESRMVCSTHAGTHVDAPAHFLEHEGYVDSIPLDRLCGPCVVFDVSHVTDAICKEHLENFTLWSPRVLLKTRNSTLASIDPFDPHFVYLDRSGATYLKDRGVQTIGIDYLGIERSQPDHATHTILLGAGVALIEGLRLTDVSEGSYILMCLPLALIGAEAAPARAVLLKELPEIGL